MRNDYKIEVSKDFQVKSSLQPLNIHLDRLNEASLVLRAINHKLRRELLQLIHDKGTINVTDIYTKMQLEQTVVSQHLAILRLAGFVITQREGKCIYYSVNHQRLLFINDLVNQLSNN